MLCVINVDIEMVLLFFVAELYAVPWFYKATTKLSASVAFLRACASVICLFVHMCTGGKLHFIAGIEKTNREY